MKYKTTHSLLRLAVIVFAVIHLGALRMEAQSLSRQVIGITGGTSQIHDISLSWTAGETIVGKATAPNGKALVTQGFQQPTLSLWSLSEDNQIQINLSPNPTPDLVNITLLDPTQENISVSLINAQGQVLLPQIIL